MPLSRLLERIVVDGALAVTDHKGRSRVYGPGGRPAAAIRIHEPAVYRRLALRPTLALGEAYMNGGVTIEGGGLRELLEICTRAAQALERHPLVSIKGNLDLLLRPIRQANGLLRSRRNVRHHYDLSSRFYELFLDSDLQYSCGYFPEGGESLDEAQTKKKRHIMAKLLLEPGMSVLDIGSGWGGLAMSIAQAQHVAVEGLTLSEEQLRAARARAAAAGLTDRVQFELRDYREERRQYDRIVSVGMFEHVGVAQYRTFFAKIRDLLRPDGAALVHSIGRMEPPCETNPWLRRYIFPGGYCPSLSETLAAIEKTGLWVTDVEIWRLHYAETLRLWNERFQANRAEIAKLYDERFCRMWEFYLAGCEMAFRHGPMMVFQLQLAKNPRSVPLARDYMVDVERRMQRPIGNRSARLLGFAGEESADRRDATAPPEGSRRGASLGGRGVPIQGTDR